MRTKPITVAVATFVCLSLIADAQEKVTPSRVLVENVRIFDGVNETLMSGSVLIEGKLVKEIGTSIEADAGATVIDGGGRVLIPGLIDMHSHLCIHEGMLDGRDDFDQMAIGAISQERMRSYLDQGFTTVRDAGGNVLGLAKAHRLGRIPGPKIYASGAFLSQTGGHGDTGCFNDFLGAEDYLEKHGFAYIVDGEAEAMKAARMNLRAGATQIKIMAGGGVASEFDPLHQVQFTLEEMKAIVGVAEDYGTYVLAHAYHDASVNRAIDAGVRCIEHNFLVSEPTIIRMKKENIALDCQPYFSLVTFANPESITFFSADQKAKGKAVNKGAAQMFEWAMKHDLIMVAGGDMFGVADGPHQAKNVVRLLDIGCTPIKALKMATSDAASVLAWCGDMNPYKDAYPDLSADEKREKGIGVGVIEEGAFADLVILEGNPLEDINVLLDYENNMKVVIVDGKVWKNTL